MKIANLFTDEWDDEQEHEGFRIQEASIRERLGAELIGGSVYEVDPARSSGRTTSPTRTRNG